MYKSKALEQFSYRCSDAIPAVPNEVATLGWGEEAQFRGDQCADLIEGAAARTSRLRDGKVTFPGPQSQRQDEPGTSCARRTPSQSNFAVLAALLSDDSSYLQKMNFIANCTLRGSPAPMPGALLALRVLVMTPKLVEAATDDPGFAQLIVLNRLNTSSRSCTDAPPLNFVVLNTDRSTLLNPGP